VKWWLLVLTACSKTAAPAPDADTHVGTANAHTVYINYDGTTLHGAAVDDATLSETSHISGETSLPAFYGGVDGRDVIIGQIIDQAKTALAPYDIAIATTRPAHGPYTMIVMTDDESLSIGGSTSIAFETCNTATNQIPGVIFKDNTTRNIAAARLVSMIAFSAAIPGSQKDGDCLCFSPPCGAQSIPCTIGGADTPINAAEPICGTDTGMMDENQRFLDAYGPAQ
jgi:hypothetical protein